MALLEDFCVTLGESLIPTPVHVHCRGEAASFLCLCSEPGMSSGRAQAGPCSPHRNGDAPGRTNPRVCLGCLSLCECLLCANTPKVTKSLPGDQQCSQIPAALAVRPRMTLPCPSELLPHHLLLLGRRRYELKQKIFS